ncbi:hypothetical protein GCM10022223_54590 [Kineosporia mesophila]|uniref:Uncharacterized protein n=1 Tax=Kineosporia mesophila TaxID=566012 RepID=A0ABP7ADT2_9ACTN|nr:hypothetical protein [Kineosporia mesophila]MCD5352765.1 hypothetical protein [Kineosporia mesophila]
MRQIQHPQGHRWVTTSVVDEEAIDHERTIGVVAVTGDEVSVRVAQRIDFDLTAVPVSIRASAPRITLGALFEMTPHQTRELAHHLWKAASFAEETTGVLRPKLVIGA